MQVEGGYNTGTNTLHMGGRFDSHLLVPIIPDAEGADPRSAD